MEGREKGSLCKGAEAFKRLYSAFSVHTDIYTLSHSLVDQVITVACAL